LECTRQVESQTIGAGCFFLISCFPHSLYGSSETQNLEDAFAHAQSITSLARTAAEQVSAMRQQRRVTHCMSILRLLQGPAGFNDRGKMMERAALSAPRYIWDTTTRIPPFDFRFAFVGLNSQTSRPDEDRA
jgi:hypothetical protein